MVQGTELDDDDGSVRLASLTFTRQLVRMGTAEQ